MIEKMLKTTIICRDDDTEETLLQLRNLGVMHVEHTKKPENQSIVFLEQGLDKLTKILNILSEYETSEAEPYSKKSPRALARMALESYDKLNEAEKKILSLDREKILLEPWGDFSFEEIDKLRDKGIYLYLCMTNKRALHFYKKYGIIEAISHDKEKIYFVLLSRKELSKDELPLVNLPASKLSLSGLKEEIEDNRKIIDESKSELSSIAQSIDDIKLFKKEVEQEHEFIYNKYGMGQETKLAYITGYVPEKKKERISNTALRFGWAVKFAKPSKDDRVPTLLKIPRIFSVITPIFSFIGISPGYKEWDVSICFLFFFTIFFALIIGDAGYGVIFLIVGIALKILFKKNRDMRLPLNLFLVLSVATIIWGALTCTYFGLPQKVLPGELHGIHALTDPKVKDSNILFICFGLGVLHLSIARVWKAIIYRRNFFEALGQIGWALFIWGNFFTALKLIVFQNMQYPVAAFCLYIIGFIFILAFYVNWTDAGSIFNAPFEFISSFVDLLSYIRLYAVGLASLYIAISFNNMAKMVYEISPWAAVFAIFVLAAGHLLNIALGFMGVLVHGIRLNTLEFSNHMELEWSGFFYKPFKRLVKDRKKQEY